MTEDATQPLIGHLVELRTRLLRCIICILLVLACLLYFSNDISIILLLIRLSVNYLKVVV